ncbi:cobalamin-binding protein [Dactylococcopsis salina]|uniref:ABC-type Fe3+-hydroxamate transport system, periplasmic component n=1 Tax=Dactylococcopsis salina (strain PCC 8305) TaxID=13035 RepID=K9YW34_DACS8|nr:cobalamin-binding protein [Dactylococcopsis salina]AFZ50697.1 ABC-type Fe3+-hydroxamate transport system, periplasmic component [Dactylococcopsis salina PCC 8305]
MTNSNTLRIVSLLPSATETVAALGLTDHLVGRSHECDYPPKVQSLPVCTEARLNSQKNSAAIDEDVQSLMQSALSIYEIKTDVLERLQPTHILTQDQCDACAVSMTQVQEATSQLVSSQPEVISLQGNVLTQVWADLKQVADRLGVDSQQALADLQSRVDACTRITDQITAENCPRVVTIEWIDPLMSGGNWLPELVKMAGGEPILDETGERSRYLDWQNLSDADPDAIVILPCGFDLDRTRKEAQVLKERSHWSQLKAVQTDRVYIADGNAYFNRPGPRLVDSLEMLAEMLHPQQFSYGYQGKSWEKL